MSSDLHDALAARDPDRISAAVYSDLIPVIPDSTDPVTYDPRELGSSGGNVFKGVAWQGKHWWRNDSSTAAADNVTCIILADGGHYLTNEVTFPQTVESRTVSAPPDSAGTAAGVVGKAWRVPSAATGTWAGHDDDVAMGSGRGWLFHTPGVGEEHYVRDEKLYESFTEDNVWADRVASLGDQTIPPSALIWDNRVENQTTNSPPASWSKGVAYIVGSSASGAWAGQSGKIALALSDGVLANGDSFEIRTPFVGQEVYNKATQNRIRWNGTAWVSAGGVWIGFAESHDLAATLTGLGTGLTCYTYAASTPFDRNKYGAIANSATISYVAKQPGAKLRISVGCRVGFAPPAGASFTGGNEPTLFILRDSELNAIAWTGFGPNIDAHAINVWASFIVAAPDANPHTYAFGISGLQIGNQLSRPLSFWNYSFTIEESA